MFTLVDNPQQLLQKIKKLNLEEKKFKKICELTIKIILSSSCSNHQQSIDNMVAKEFQSSHQISHSFNLLNAIGQGLLLIPKEQRDAEALSHMTLLLENVFNGYAEILKTSPSVGPRTTSRCHQQF